MGNVVPESGGFVKPIPQKIGPKSKDTFIWTNREDSPAGAAGKMDWILGFDTAWEIRWSNPRTIDYREERP